MKFRATATVTAVVSLAALALTGCTSSGSDHSDDGSITFWLQEDLPERVAATEKIVDDFTEESGIEVDVVPVAEDQFSQLITSSAAAGDLPDVLAGISLPQVRTLAGNEFIDSDAVASIIEDLDPTTFSKKALELTADGDTPLAVPSESWTQMLFYRTDLFEAAGLEAPKTYDDILAAAKKLDSDDLAGFVGATAPGDAFTEQTFEQIALGNDCQLVDSTGNVTLDSPECVEAFSFYGELTNGYSVPGAQDVDTTRASYFAGDAAMFIWSSFVLDEMAGLRDDALPSCPKCTDDPGFLAKNTGVVTTLSGPGATSSGQFGEITSWTVTEGAATDSAQAFIEYMMNDGYQPWIAIAPEGKVPARAGTPDEPTKFSDMWATLPVGVDTKAPLSDFYAPEVLDAIAAGPKNLARWGITQGQGMLLGALQGELPVATAVNEVSQGGDPAESAKTAAETVRAIAESLK